ncbi:acyltransferase, partial [Escherichia coli]
MDILSMIKNELKSIQILRGLAALMVVLYHFRTVLNYDNVRMGDYLFGKGFIGVDLFFVISGFIMAYTTNLTHDAIADVKSFAIKRVSRIYPVLFTSFIIASLSFMNFERVLSQSFFETLSSLALIPTTSSLPPFFIDTHSILGVRWTLNYEVYFYSIFAISLFFGKRRYYVLLAWIIMTVFFTQILING